MITINNKKELQSFECKLKNIDNKKEKHYLFYDNVILNIPIITKGEDSYCSIDMSNYDLTINEEIFNVSLLNVKKLVCNNNLDSNYITAETIIGSKITSNGLIQCKILNAKSVMAETLYVGKEIICDKLYVEKSLSFFGKLSVNELWLHSATFENITANNIP